MSSLPRGTVRRGAESSRVHNPRFRQHNRTQIRLHSFSIRTHETGKVTKSSAGYMTTRKRKPIENVAGGGLLHRRLFLSSSVGAAGLALLRARPADASEQDVPSWMKVPGEGLRPYR